MEMTVQFEDLGLAASIRDIKRLSHGRSFEDISKIAAARVLKTAMHYTPAAAAGEMTVRSRIHALQRTGLTRAAQGGDSPVPGAITINAGRKGGAKSYGRVWRFTENRKWQMVLDAGFSRKGDGRRVSDKAWTDVKEAVADFRYSLRQVDPVNKAARGLAKNSFYQGLEAMGINHRAVPPLFVRYPNWVLNARASNGRMYRNGVVHVVVDGSNIDVTYINTLPYAPTTGGLVKYLNDAIATTRKGIQGDLERGIFENYKVLAKRWPILVEAA